MAASEGCGMKNRAHWLPTGVTVAPLPGHNPLITLQRLQAKIAADCEETPLREAKLPTTEDFAANPVPGEPSHEEILKYMAEHPPEPPEADAVRVPLFWTKGQLLNVRNGGEHYVVTLLGEEFDPRYPERALKFANSTQCQDFVSRWYQRETYDGRA